MAVEFHRGSPGKFDSGTLSRETLGRWTERSFCEFWLELYIYIYIYAHLSIYTAPVVREILRPERSAVSAVPRLVVRLIIIAINNNSY